MTQDRMPRFQAPPQIGMTELERILKTGKQRTINIERRLQGGWVDITLATGFGDLTAFNWRKPQYHFAGGRLDFRGLINRTGALTAANVTLFTMGVGLRVTGTNSGQIFNQRANVGTAEVSVFADGTVKNGAAMATNAWTSLDGLYYYVD